MSKRSWERLGQLEPERLLLDQIAASPRYLHGIHGVVVDLDEHTAVVRVQRPIGRFKSGEIRCPPLALDRLRPAA